jgi:peptidylprolyl isomerase
MRKVASLVCFCLILSAGISLSGCIEKKPPKKEGLARIDVTKRDGNEPAVVIPNDLKIHVNISEDGQSALNVFQIVDQGDGEELQDGQNVDIGYSVYAMPEMNKQYSSWESDSPTNNFPMFENQSDPNDLYQVLKGLKVGALILEAIPGQKATGQASESIANGDPLSALYVQDTIDLTGANYSLMVLQVLAAKNPLLKADGEDVPDLNQDLPKVTLNSSGVPSVEISPDWKVPDTLQVQPLKHGRGDVVTEDSNVVLQYSGWFSNGAQFESSWGGQRPPSISFKSMISGWQKSLLGKAVGSQLLLVVPPSLAYGKNGNDSVPPNSTVIFVVDILDVV